MSQLGNDPTKEDILNYLKQDKSEIKPTPILGKEDPIIAEDYTDKGDLSAGWSSGVTGLKSIYHAGRAWYNTVTDDPEEAKYHAGEAAKLEKKSEALAKGRTTKLEDIDDFGEAVDWAQFQLGSVAPSIAETIGVSALGAGIGSATGTPVGTVGGALGGFLGKSAVKKYLAKQTNKYLKRELKPALATQAAKRDLHARVGAGIGLWASGGAMGVGDIYGEIMDEEGKGDTFLAAAGAIPYAALDAITELSILKRAVKGTGADKALKRYAKAVGTGVALEGSAESAQEALIMAAGIQSGKSYSTEEVLSRLGNSFAAGGLAGGIMSAPGGRVQENEDVLNENVPYTKDFIKTDAGYQLDPITPTGKALLADKLKRIQGEKDVLDFQSRVEGREGYDKIPLPGSEKGVFADKGIARAYTKMKRLKELGDRAAPRQFITKLGYKHNEGSIALRRFEEMKDEVINQYIVGDKVDPTYKTEAIQALHDLGVSQEYIDNKINQEKKKETKDDQKEGEQVSSNQQEREEPGEQQDQEGSTEEVETGRVLQTEKVGKSTLIKDQNDNYFRGYSVDNQELWGTKEQAKKYKDPTKTLNTLNENVSQLEPSYTITDFESDSGLFTKEGFDKVETIQQKRKGTQRIFSFLKSNPLLDDVKFNFFEDVGELDQGYREHFGENIPKAFIHRGRENKIFINLNAFDNIQQIKGGIVHELVGHYGTRKSLGPQYDSFIKSALNNQKLVVEMDSVLGSRYENESPEKRMEEYVSELARYKFEDRELTKSQTSLYNRAVNRIRHILRKMGLINVDEETINQILRNSYNRVIGGETQSTSIFEDTGISEMSKDKRETSGKTFFKAPYSFSTEPVEVLINPSKSKLLGFRNRTKEKEIRIIVDENDTLYAWDASLAQHWDAMSGLKIQDTPFVIEEVIGTNDDSKLDDIFKQRGFNISHFEATDVKEENLRKNIRKTLDKVDVGIGNAQSRGRIIDSWRNLTKAIRNRIRSVFHLSGMANIDDRDMVNILQRNAIGKINTLNRHATQLHKKVFKPLEKQGRKDTLDLLSKLWRNGTIHNLATSASGNVTTQAYITLPKEVKDALSPIQINMLKQWNDYLVANQNWLAEQGLLDKTSKTFKENYGSYLPRMYLDSIDQYRGSGFHPSSMTWRMRIEDPEGGSITKNEIQDPETLILQSVMQIGHDAAKLELLKSLKEVSQIHGKGWVLGQGTKTKVELNKGPYFSEDIAEETVNKVIVNKSLSGFHRLLVRIEKARINAIENKEPALKIKAIEDNIDTLQQVIKDLDRQIVDEYGIDPGTFQEQYVFVNPRKHRTLGEFRGAYVHRELWNELFGSTSSVNSAGIETFANDMLSTRVGKTVERGNAFWKAFKTVWNVPGYWVRAALGTAMLADMASDTPTPILMKYFAQELNNWVGSGKGKEYGGKTLSEWGIELGAGGTSIGEGELYQITRNIKSKVNTSQLKAYLKEAENGKTKWFHTGHLLTMLASDKIASVTETLADANANMDFSFKLMLMRDFIEGYQKSNKGTTAAIENMTQNQIKYLMEQSIAYAARGVPEYNINIPGLIQTLRRSAFGAPFLTFNYKLASMMADSFLNRPQKLIKYPVLGWMLTNAMLDSLEDEEDYKEAIKNMPYWTKNKSAILPIPGKDDQGRMSYLDLSYVIPPMFYIDMFNSVLNPLPGESSIGNLASAATDEFGLFGGVVPQLIAASTTNTNPFTNQPISREGNSTLENAKGWGEFLWNLATIPALSSTGALGDILNQHNIDSGLLPPFTKGVSNTNYGLDKQSMWSDIITNLGITVRDVNPQEQAVKNIKWMNRNLMEINKNISYIKKQMAAKNINREDGISKLRDAYQRRKILQEESLKLLAGD